MSCALLVAITKMRLTNDHVEQRLRVFNVNLYFPNLYSGKFYSGYFYLLLFYIGLLLLEISMSNKPWSRMRRDQAQ